MATSHLRFPPSTTSTIASVTSSATSGTILAANSNRLGAFIFNRSNANLYLLLTTGTASITNFTHIVGTYKSFEVPSGYQGIIIGIWQPTIGIGGFASVTEFTP